MDSSIDGVVLEHGPVKNKVYNHLKDAPSPCAIRYTGEIRGSLFEFYAEEVDSKDKS